MFASFFDRLTVVVDTCTFIASISAFLNIRNVINGFTGCVTVQDKIKRILTSVVTYTRISFLLSLG